MPKINALAVYSLLLPILLGACKPQSSSGTIYTTNDAGEVVPANDPLYRMPKEYKFSNIAWGSSKMSTQKAMSTAGFKFTRLDDEGDQVYEGKLAGEDTTIFASFTNKNRLVRIQLVTDVPENKFFQKYEIIKDALRDKYGDPYKDSMSFDAPYKEGDGNESQAIRLGKATFNSEWWTTYVKNPGEETSSAHAGLTMFVKDKLLIYVTYTDKAWGSEYDRRYKKGTGNL